MVNTWNEGFNEAATACGLTANDLKRLDGRVSIKGWEWQRLGSRIQCANGAAVWTVEASEVA